MDFDAVVCVSAAHRSIAVKAVRALLRFAGARKIFVVMDGRQLDSFRRSAGADSRLVMLDENAVADYLSLDAIRSELNRRIGEDRRAGWYFQQFLKMAMCAHADLADHYLIWDSDTLLLQPVEFFDEEGRVLLKPGTESHAAYFQTLERLLGLKKRESQSFIAEHFMIDKRIMLELIAGIESAKPRGRNWVEHVLDCVDDADLAHSGFSEFETYGSFLSSRYPDSYSWRGLRSMRAGTRRFGTNPGPAVLYHLMTSGYAIASFETWHRTPALRIALYRAMSCLRYRLSRMAGTHAEKRRAADFIGS